MLPTRADVLMCDDAFCSSQGNRCTPTFGEAASIRQRTQCETTHTCSHRNHNRSSRRTTHADRNNIDFRLVLLPHPQCDPPHQPCLHEPQSRLHWTTSRGQQPLFFQHESKVLIVPCHQLNYVKHAFSVASHRLIPLHDLRSLH